MRRQTVPDSERPTPSVTLDIDSKMAGAAYSAFEDWAIKGASVVQVFFSPDVMMATESAERSGYLLDEVYFLTIWANRGVDQLRAELYAAGVQHSVKESEPNPESILRLIIDEGASIDTQRGLL